MIRSLFAACLWLSFAPLCLRAAESDTAPGAWERIAEYQKTPAPMIEMADGKPVVTREYLEGISRRDVELGELLLRFIRGFPADSRHWDAIVELTRLQHTTFTQIGDVRALGMRAAVIDLEAQKRWNAEVGQWVSRLIAAPDVSPANLQAGQEKWASLGLFDAGAAPQGERIAAIREARRRLDALGEKFPDTQMRRMYEWEYATRLRQAEPQAVPEYLRRMSADGNKGIAAWARGELAMDELRRQPIELAFTALDGREVDLAKLRGKVVLMDFWATWCKPCVALLPELKKLYGKYHDQGLEIIGVSLDKPADREKLTDFVRRQELPWAQHFDAVNQTNELADRYGIVGIPAMFLFDSGGRLVSLDAGPDALESAVKRLLGSTGG